MRLWKRVYINNSAPVSVYNAAAVPGHSVMKMEKEFQVEAEAERELEAVMTLETM